MDTPSHRLKHARVSAGFSSATKAAQAFRWNENTYRSHENGERDFKRAAAERYAAAFKIALQWLLFGEGPDRNYSQSLLAGYVTDVGRVVKETDGIEVEILGTAQEGLNLALLVQTLDLEPRFELNDIVIISDTMLDFFYDDTHTAGSSVWCYVESDDYRPVLAPVSKAAGTAILTLKIPSRHGDAILRGAPNTVDVEIPTGSLRAVRPVQGIVTQHGWRYRIGDAVERLKTPTT